MDNSTPRPSTFCGIARGSDHLGTAGITLYLLLVFHLPNFLFCFCLAYNTAWQQYITALGNYLDGIGVLNKTYYYVQNEPQTLADDKLAGTRLKIRVLIALCLIIDRHSAFMSIVESCIAKVANSRKRRTKSNDCRRFVGSMWLW